MSSHERIQVTCPKCQHAQEFENWPSVNVTLHPELRERVISGALFTLTCAKCSEETTVKKALLYNDMERGFMVCLAPAEPPALPSTDAVNLAKVRLRWVQTPAHLIEKIRIFEDGLDDQLIEVQKILMAELIEEELRDKPLALLYDGLEDSPKDGQQIGFLVFLEKSVRKIRFHYAELQKDGSRLLSAMRAGQPVESGRWLQVDNASTMQWLSSLDTDADDRERIDES